MSKELTIKRLEAKLADLTQKLAEQKRKIATHEIQADHLNRVNEELQAELDNYKSNWDALAKDALDFEDKNIKLEAELIAVKGDRKRWEELWKGQQADLATMTKIRDFLKTECNQEAELTAKDEELEKYKDALAEGFNNKLGELVKPLKATITAKDKRIVELEGGLEKLGIREPGDFCDCDLIARQILGYNPRE